MRNVLLIAVVLWTAACDQLKKGSGAKDDAGAADDAATAVAPPETPVEQAQKAPNLAAAFAIAKPHMTDEPNRTDEGTQILIAWASKSMRFADVGVTAEETNIPLVIKDPESERGKRLCVTGQLADIAVERGDIGAFSVGTLDTGGQHVRFFGVGTSGTLVASNRAKFCGVVTGRFDFINGVGTPIRAVKLVGMFDLPANRLPLGVDAGDVKPAPTLAPTNSFIPPPQPTPRPTPTPPPPPPPPTQPFDRSQAAAALSAVDVGACRGGGAAGPQHVTVTFVPDGSVISAVVDQGSAIGTFAAQCLSARFRAVRVRPFAGTSVKVGKSVTL